MTPLEGLAAIGAACVVAATLAQGPRWWRRIAFTLYLPALALPFLIVDDQRFVRAACGLWVFAGGMRLYELAREPTPRPWIRRVLAMTFIYDVRFVAGARPRVAWRLWLGALVTASIGAAGFWLLSDLVDADTAPPVLVARWVTLLVAFYGVMIALDWVLTASLALAGLAVRPTHDHPILARSIGELWFRRWNREVGRWLDVHLFRPLARRRRAGLGVFMAFAFSAVLHVFPTAAGAGLVAAGLAGAFFVAHGVVALLERRLRVVRWPAVAARAWTAGVVLVTWPLFAEPMIAVLYGPAASVLVRP